MKRLLLLGWLACVCLSLFAQQKAPKWMEKQKKAIAKITTYKEDGTTLHTGTGFFISEDGKLLSAYSLFNGAYKATVTDGGGKTYEVSTVLAADELYDVIKLQVEVPKKVSFLKMAAAPLVVGAPVYLQPYTADKVKTFATGKVEEVTKLKDVYHYYKLSFPLEVSWVNAPVLNEEGEVFGLAQEDASGQALSDGMSGMFSLCIVMLLVRGMIGLITDRGGIDRLINSIMSRVKTRRGAEYSIAILVSIICFALVNNTIAIIIAAPIAKKIGEDYGIAPKRLASLLDIFACFVLATAPHSGGVMMMTSAADVSPLAILKYSVYPFMLAICTLITIHFGLMRTEEEKQRAELEKAKK